MKYKKIQMLFLATALSVGLATSPVAAADTGEDLDANVVFETVVEEGGENGSGGSGSEGGSEENNESIDPNSSEGQGEESGNESEDGSSGSEENGSLQSVSSPSKNEELSADEFWGTPDEEGGEGQGSEGGEGQEGEGQGNDNQGSDEQGGENQGGENQGSEGGEGQEGEGGEGEQDPSEDQEKEPIDTNEYLMGKKGMTLYSISLPDGQTWEAEDQPLDELGEHEFIAKGDDDERYRYTVSVVNANVELPKNLSAKRWTKLGDVKLPNGFKWENEKSKLTNAGKQKFLSLVSAGGSTCHIPIEVDVAYADSDYYAIHVGDTLADVNIENPPGYTGNGFVWNETEVPFEEVGEYVVNAHEKSNESSKNTFVVTVLPEDVEIPLSTKGVYGQKLSEIDSPIPGKLVWKNDIELKEIGTKQFTAFYNDDAEGQLTVRVTVEIERATPDIEKELRIEVEEGTTLTDSLINSSYSRSDGYYRMVTSGVKAENKNYKVVFIPDDQEHYNKVEDVILTVVVKAKPTEKPTAKPTKTPEKQNGGSNNNNSGSNTGNNGNSGSNSGNNTNTTPTVEPTVEPTAKPTATPTPTAKPKKEVHVKSVSITNLPSKMKTGQSISLKAKVSPSNATNKKVTYVLSHTNLATLSKGVLTIKDRNFLPSGSTIYVTVKSLDTNVSKTYEVEVVAKVAVVKSSSDNTTASGRDTTTSNSDSSTNGFRNVVVSSADQTTNPDEAVKKDQEQESTTSKLRNITITKDGKEKETDETENKDQLLDEDGNPIENKDKTTGEEDETSTWINRPTDTDTLEDEDDGLTYDPSTVNEDSIDSSEANSGRSEEIIEETNQKKKSPLPWILALLGIGAAGGGGYYFYRKKKQE